MLARARVRWLVAALFVVQSLRPIAPAAAQSPPEIVQARQLFAEALADEQQRLFAIALEKFRRVQRVRDTISVRYRIGACLEGLGRLREARASFDAIVADGAKATGDDVATVRSAATRVDDLAARIPKVTLRLSPRAPVDAEVRIDQRVVATSALSDPLSVDPGDHVVEATGTGASPFRTRFTVGERARIDLTIALDPAGAPIATPTVSGPLPSGASSRDAPPRPPPEGSSILPAVAMVGGGVLVVASVVTLLLRHGDIADLKTSCQGGCPGSRASELESIRSRALVEGPLGVAFGAAGLALAGIGLYFVLSPRNADPSAKTAASISIGPDGVLRLRGAF